MEYKKTMRIYLKKRFFYLIKILNILFGNFQISMLKMTYVYNITIFADVKQNQFENKETKKNVWFDCIHASCVNRECPTF